MADVAIALAEAGEHQGAKQAIDLLQKNKPGSHLTPRIVEALVKADAKQEANRFLEPLLQFATSNRNEWALGDCAIALAFTNPMRARQIALTMAEKSSTTGYSRRDSTLAGIAAIQAKGNDVSGALETIDLAHDPQTHDTTLQIMAEDFVKLHDLPHALEIAKAIKHPTWKHTLAKVQSLMGDTPGAMRLATSLPNSFDKSTAFSAIVDAQITLNSLRDAIQTAGLIEQENIKDRTYTELAKAHAKAGQLTAATALTDKIMWQRRAEVTRQIGSTYAASGQWKEAWKLPRESSNLPGKDSLTIGLIEGMLDYRATQNNKSTSKQ